MHPYRLNAIIIILYVTMKVFMKENPSNELLIIAHTKEAKYADITLNEEISLVNT